MLFAGITSIFSFKYSLLNDIVKRLKRWSKSAGNSFIYLSNIMYTKYIEFYSINKIGTSETLRNETVITTENVKSITVHCLPRSIELNGGSIRTFFSRFTRCDGHFSSKQQLVLVFNSLDASLADPASFVTARFEEARGERLGFGSVHKVKDKNLCSSRGCPLDCPTLVSRCPPPPPAH